MSNPLIYLFAQTWRYSAGNRRTVVVYFVLFLIAGTTSMLGFPWVWATASYWAKSMTCPLPVFLTSHRAIIVEAHPVSAVK